MNRKSAVSLGPGASSLILIFVVLALSVLGMLSLLTARNDLKFSERSAEVIQNVYLLNETAETRRAEAERILAECEEEGLSGEEFLLAAAEALPAELEMDGEEIFWTEEIVISLDPDDPNDPKARTMMLDCALQILQPAEKNRTQWIRHDLTVSAEDEWN